MPETMPGTLSGNITRRKVCKLSAAKILRGLDEAWVELHYDGIERHYHVGQVVVHHAHYDAAGVPYQRKRADTENTEEIVDYAVSRTRETSASVRSRKLMHIGSVTSR